MGNWFLYCDEHKKQPLKLIGGIGFTIFTGIVANILFSSYFSNTPSSDISNANQINNLANTNFKPLNDRETSKIEKNKRDSNDNKTIKNEITPDKNLTNKNLEKNKKEITQKETVKKDKVQRLDLLEKAKTLYSQAKYQEALSICNAFLAVNPKNREGINLRSRIQATINTLKNN